MVLRAFEARHPVGGVLGAGGGAVASQVVLIELWRLCSHRRAPLSRLGYGPHQSCLIQRP